MLTPSIVAGSERLSVIAGSAGWGRIFVAHAAGGSHPPGPSSSFATTAHSPESKQRHLGRRSEADRGRLPALEADAAAHVEAPPAADVVKPSGATSADAQIRR